MDENTTPFAGAEIVTSAPETVPPPKAPPVAPVPLAPPNAVPWNPKATKVPRAFVDENTGSVVEIAKKDQTFLRHYVELGKAGAMKYANINAGRADHVLKLPAIQQYLRKALLAAGVTDTKLAQRVAEGLDATVPAKEFVVKNVDGSTSLASGKAGVPDMDQRGKYIDRAFRLQGMDKPEPAAGAGSSPLPTLGALAALKPGELMAVLDALKRQQAQDEAVEAEVITAEPDGPPAFNSDGSPTEPPTGV